MKWLLKINEKLGGKVITVLTIALLLSLSTVVFTDTWIASIKPQTDRIAQVKNNVVVMRKLHGDLFEAESAQRGFILTQQEVYLEPFNAAINDARVQLLQIQGLLTSGGDRLSLKKEKEWITSLSASIESRIATMQLTSLLVKQGKVEEAEQAVFSNKGLVDMLKIKKALQQMIADQEKSLIALQTTRDSTTGVARASVYGSALVLVLLVIMVIKQLLKEMVARDQLRERLNVELENYEMQLDNQTRLLQSLALDAQSDIERERQKLAHELHDELGSILTATKMDVSWSIRKSKDIAPEVSEKLSKTMRYLDRGIEFKREVVQNLRPSMIETFGFWPALRSLIDGMVARTQWQMKVNLPDDSTEISETVSLIVYRVLQETLNNAAKYAKASEVVIDIIVESDNLKMEIEDNGVGMDMDAMQDTTHGLKGMKNRIMAIGGSFVLVSAPGQGFISRAIIPLNLKRARDGRSKDRRSRAV